jgi:hypothetical protein
MLDTRQVREIWHKTVERTQPEERFLTCRFDDQSPHR